MIEAWQALVSCVSIAHRGVEMSRAELCLLACRIPIAQRV